jgi:hypothetical protein
LGCYVKNNKGLNMGQIKAGETLFRELFEVLGFANEQELFNHETRLFPIG